MSAAGAIFSTDEDAGMSEGERTYQRQCRGTGFLIPGWAWLPSGGDGAAGHRNLRRQPLRGVAPEGGVGGALAKSLLNNNEF